ncbi:uncharacterized protein METZ01_LOCUS180099 [marine metagenome]|uniref:Uncharacterized protein n=1 Tax=marine metagenome TaxID=408172 RepID=A0A382CME5_9ZZZZ
MLNLLNKKAKKNTYYPFKTKGVKGIYTSSAQLQTDKKKFSCA